MPPEDPVNPADDDHPSVERIGPFNLARIPPYIPGPASTKGKRAYRSTSDRERTALKYAKLHYAPGDALVAMMSDSAQRINAAVTASQRELRRVEAQSADFQLIVEMVSAYECWMFVDDHAASMAGTSISRIQQALDRVHNPEFADVVVLDEPVMQWEPPTVPLPEKEYGNHSGLNGTHNDTEM